MAEPLEDVVDRNARVDAELLVGVAHQHRHVSVAENGELCGLADEASLALRVGDSPVPRVLDGRDLDAALHRLLAARHGATTASRKVFLPLLSLAGRMSRAFTYRILGTRTLSALVG